MRAALIVALALATATAARADHCEESNIGLGIGLFVVGAVELGFASHDAVVDRQGRAAGIAEAAAGGAAVLASGLLALGVGVRDDCEDGEPSPTSFLPLAVVGAGLLAHAIESLTGSLPPPEPERFLRVQAAAGLLSNTDAETCYQGACFTLGDGWYARAGVDVSLLRRLTAGLVLTAGALSARRDLTEESLAYVDGALTVKVGVPIARPLLMRPLVHLGVGSLEGFGGARLSYGAGLEVVLSLGARLRVVAELGVSAPQPLWRLGVGAAF